MCEAKVAKLAEVLTDRPVTSPQEVFERCEALDALSELGTYAYPALPAIVRSLWVEVQVDCRLWLRVAAAETAWKVGGLSELALPIIAWGLKDEYWGVSRRAVKILKEMGPIAHAASPELIQLADRLLESVRSNPTMDQQQLLAEVAVALGNCGRGPHFSVVYSALTRIAKCNDKLVKDASEAAIASLDVSDDGITPENLRA